MKQNILLLAFLFILLLLGFSHKDLFETVKSQGFVSGAQTQNMGNIPSPTRVPYKAAPQRYSLQATNYIGQTFNNCGPATLSMVFSWYGKDVSQDTLGQQMRPYQNPQGDNDDKSVFPQEIVHYSKEYGFGSVYRPDGDIELLKKLVANDVPVIVRSWLNSYEQIGHFKIIRGYDDSRQILIQDDSYQGRTLEMSYEEFLSIWQPFNYEYMLVYPKEKEAIVRSILGENWDQQTAFTNAVKRAQDELAQNPGSAYSQFNLATSYYQLGDYKKSVENYEISAPNLPWRMLWYQIEPIMSYQRLGNYDQVFSLTDSILSNNNYGFSELYAIRAQAFRDMGDDVSAQAEDEKALFYNTHFNAVKSELVPQKPLSSYWFLLHRKSNIETLYKGEVGNSQKSTVVKRFQIKPGAADRPTPLPNLVGRKYWILVEKHEEKDNPETAPYFMTLNIPFNFEEPYGPVPYTECNGQQCNWMLPGAFGLHGVNGDNGRLSKSDPGSSGCIRHSNNDITYLYNLLSPEREEIRYYIENT